MVDSDTLSGAWGGRFADDSALDNVNDLGREALYRPDETDQRASNVEPGCRYRHADGMIRKLLPASMAVANR
jgi:hypothetical protein